MINVAIVGVGNCASSLVQGVEYYKDALDTQVVPGLMHVNLGKYHIRDIKFVAAFDVVEGKVGKDLASGIHACPNNTFRFAEVPDTGVLILRGPTMDGLGKYVRPLVKESTEQVCDVVSVLKQCNVDVLINYLPVGSEEAAYWYANCALQAGCAFINCIPVFIASKPLWQKEFTEHGLPVIGDDIKSQLGATIVHRMLATLCGDRGVRVDRSYQLNIGGNSDFLNMLERERLSSKKESKTAAVRSVTQNNIDGNDLHVGPSDYVPWLEDRKFCFIRMEGTTFGDVPIELDLHLRVWDSPNSAGVVIDAIRLAKIGLDRGLGGPLVSASAYLMKSPPKQMRDDLAGVALKEFIEGVQ